MTHFRQLLIYLRSNLYKKQEGLSFLAKLMIATSILVVVGILFDWLLPFSLFFTTFRSLLALTLGFAVFSLVWMLATIQGDSNKKNNSSYVEVRKWFSHKQRKNIGIVLLGLLVLLTMLLSKPSNFYTLMSGFIVAGILGVVAFIRPYRREYIKEKYDIPDVRDLQFEQERYLKREEQLNQKEKVDEEE